MLTSFLVKEDGTYASADLGGSRNDTSEYLEDCRGVGFPGSVPVLSWLFNHASTIHFPKKEMNLPAYDECLWPSFHPKNSRETIPRQNNSQKDNSWSTQTCMQPLEPILVPKLRIQFAEFPYLPYSIN